MTEPTRYADCQRCLGTGEWVVCQYQDYCEDDCLVIGCPDCGARIDDEVTTKPTT